MPASHVATATVRAIIRPPLMGTAAPTRRDNDGPGRMTAIHRIAGKFDSALTACTLAGVFRFVWIIGETTGPSRGSTYCGRLGPEIDCHPLPFPGEGDDCQALGSIPTPKGRALFHFQAAIARGGKRGNLTSVGNGP
jgi:hypothetical protein